MLEPMEEDTAMSPLPAHRGRDTVSRDRDGKHRDKKTRRQADRTETQRERKGDIGRRQGDMARQRQRDREARTLLGDNHRSEQIRNGCAGGQEGQPHHCVWDTERTAHLDEQAY